MSTTKQEPPPATDEQLAARAAAGCVESFEQLVERFQTPLLHFLRKRARSWEDAEDLVQEAFVRAYQKLHRYDSRWRFSTWLFTIAYRLNLNELRQRRPLPENEQFALIADGEAEPLAEITAREDRSRLWDAAAETLNELQYNIVWLFYVEEMAVKEIAEVLGKSRVAIKTTLFRARKKLMPILEEYDGAFAKAPATSRPAAPQIAASGLKTARSVG